MAMEGRKCDAVVAASSSPPWVDLPRDVTTNILHRLGEEELLRSAQLVCSSWWRISKDPTLWRVLNFSNPDKQNWLCDYDHMCRCAVDRSCGELVDLTVQYYGFDINYIADRSPNLKRLRIGVCFTIAGDYVIAGDCRGRVVAKLPQLEELHLTIGPGVGAGSIKALGYACPNLKSFSLNSLNCKFVPLEDDEYESLEFYRNLCALAISLSMPNLRHLQLFAHWIEDEGLEDILDGCPHLESLDVRRCFDLRLEGDLEKRCRQMIKHLKLPNDPVSDSDVPWPNCDGCNMFGADAYSEEYVYKYYEDSLRSLSS